MRRILAVLIFLIAVPAMAQERRGAASAAGGKSDGGARSGAAGGQTAGASGGGTSGAVSSGASHGSSSTGGGSAARSGAGTHGAAGAGGRHAAEGGSSAATSRAPERGTYAGNGGRHGGTATTEPATGRAATPASATVGGGAARGEAGRQNAHASDGASEAYPAHARRRDGNEPVVDKATPRGSVPPPGNGGAIGIGGFYPWWLGGVGYYGGYYGGYYDPWFGGYPDDYGYGQPPIFSGGFDDEGSLRLKIKPREAEVYVDGYYVGIVDDFDGIFQKLHIEAGPHHVDVRAPGYDPLSFDVRIAPDHTTTYQAEMKKSS